MQSRGLFAFQEPEIVAALALTPGQQSKIRELELEGYARMHRAMRSDHGPQRGNHGPPHEKPDLNQDSKPRFKPEDMRRDFEAYQREAVKNALALLTPDQLERWRDLTGTPFDAIVSPGPPGPFGPPPGEFDGPDRGPGGPHRGPVRDDGKLSIPCPPLSAQPLPEETE